MSIPGAPLERLNALAGASVYASILRAVDQQAQPVVREGRLRLSDAAAASDAPVAHLLDADELPIVTVLGRDGLSLVDDRVRVTLRPTMRVDFAERPPVGPQIDEIPELTLASVARELAAELEAGFRADLLMRPDPDPPASLRARYGSPPVEPRPLGDGSWRFAVDHAAATLYADGESALRLVCVGSDIRFGRQYADRYQPPGGARYVFVPDEIVRLGADIRAFLSGRWERFGRLA